MFKYMLSAGLLLSSLAPGQAAPDDDLPPMGLKFASAAQLRDVPPAEMPYGGYGAAPLRVDLSEDMPEPGLQGRQNSCVAWASAYAVKTYQEKREQRYPLRAAGQLDLHRVFSPAFVYNQINEGHDRGATLVDALRLLQERGAVSLASMPYRIEDFTTRPSKRQLKQALRYRIDSWRRLIFLHTVDLKAQLQAGYPVMIGTLIDESFRRLRAGTVWQHSAGRSYGGHAMVLVGYDDGRNAFKVMNSWGTGWADRGFGWIDYHQMETVIREAYVAKDAPNQDADKLAALPRMTQRPAPADDRPSAGASPGDLASSPQMVNRNDRDQLQEEENAEETLVLRRQRIENGELILDGRALLSQAGDQAQVLVRFYADSEATLALHALTAPYVLPDGSAVAPSPPLDAGVGYRHWQARIPLAQLPGDLSKIWARPVLYVDRFGVDSGRSLPILLPGR